MRETRRWLSAAGLSASARGLNSTIAASIPPGHLQESGYKAIMVNSNPETVSTDFDTSDRLYFEALDEESLRDILENEGGNGEAPPSIVQFGGQTAINLAEPLFRSGMPLLGSSAEAIDLAEDRRRFENFLNELGIPQPPGAGVTSAEEALSVAKLIGYPGAGPPQLCPRRPGYGDSPQLKRA